MSPSIFSDAFFPSKNLKNSKGVKKPKFCRIFLNQVPLVMLEEGMLKYVFSDSASKTEQDNSLTMFR